MGAGESEILEGLVIDLAQGKAGPGIELGRYQESLQALGLPPETSQNIWERVKPALVIYEKLTGEGPDQVDLTRITMSVVADEQRVAAKVKTYAVWVAQESRFREVPEGEKRRWDDIVAKTDHQDPARVGAYRLLGDVLPRETSREVVQETADKILAVVKRLLQDAEVQKVPEEKRDLYFWKELAKAAWMRVDGSQRLMQAGPNRGLVLETAIDWLSDQLFKESPALWGIYASLRFSEYLQPPPYRHIDHQFRGPSMEQLTKGRSLEPEEQQRLARIQISGQAITVDQHRLTQTSSFREQQLARLHLLRALLGKDSLAPAKAAQLVSGRPGIQA